SFRSLSFFEGKIIDSDPYLQQCRTERVSTSDQLALKFCPYLFSDYKLSYGVLFGNIPVCTKQR
ncbi:hypothetical protein, partial [Acinetobacter baumannii]|uniref:hypothetical protein n=1 Tax=Acinetobacter baumannii TaxID=470 RepID=UPI001C0698AD